MENSKDTANDHEECLLVNEISSKNPEDDESEDENIFVFKKKDRGSRKNMFHLASDDEGIPSTPLSSSKNGASDSDESRDSNIASKSKVKKKKRVMKIFDDGSSAEEDNQKPDLDESIIKSDRIENKRNIMVDKFKNRFDKKTFFIETSDNVSDPKDPKTAPKFKNKVRKRNDSDKNITNEGEFKNISSLKENTIKQSRLPETVEKSIIMDIIGQNSSGSDNSDERDPEIKNGVQQKKLKELCDDDSESDMSDRGSDHDDRSQSHVSSHEEHHDEQPKEMRLSAKQAMENMQKIKSESNRMLREKEVSLPYHRPRQMSLKDILNRRKPITGLDGKNLPIKMNEEQLKQYAQQLEERQKEIIELCKSESEEGSDEEDAVEVAATVSDSEKRTESPTETVNQLAHNDMINDEKSSTVTEEVERPKEPEVRNCNQYEIDTKVDFGDYTENTIIKDNTELKLCTMDTGTQIEGLEKETKHVSVHETNTNVDSQAMELSYSEHTETFCKESKELRDNSEKSNILENTKNECCQETVESTNNDHYTEAKETIDETPSGGLDHQFDDNFSDDDVDMSQIEDIIDKMEEERNKENSQPTNIKTENMKVPTFNPKLSGAPGSVIDLDFDSAGPKPPKKLTGIDLLKEKFVYFSKLKTPEEKEREKEKIIKPGHQHLKLKLELEEQMAEQRSLEWAKRMEEDKVKQQEMKQMNGELSDCEDILDDCFEKDEKEAPESSQEDCEEEEISDQEIEDKPRKTNPLVDDQAEEDEDQEDEEEIAEDNEDNVESEGDNEEDSSGEETGSEEEDELEDKPKKPKQSRILKAFEDSDDEEITSAKEEESRSSSVHVNTVSNVLETEVRKTIDRADTDDIFATQQSQSDKAYDCDDLPLAQQNSSFTQETQSEDADVNTNTVSVEPQMLQIIPNTQQYTQIDLADIVGMCSGSFPSTQGTFGSPTGCMIPGSMSQMIQMSGEVQGSQDIGEDVLVMCTGQFAEGIISPTTIMAASKAKYDEFSDDGTQKIKSVSHNSKLNASLCDLLDVGPKADRGMSFFSPHLPEKPANNKENIGNRENFQTKGKLVIMSSDEEEAIKVYPEGKKKVMKNRKRHEKKRNQLQISDDEDSNLLAEMDSLANSDENIDRLVEYDSEENEVEVEIGDITKKIKRRSTDFLDQEAELSSEDEWRGSGDEDEAGLDQLEREDGDDDHYNQKKLRSELGKIHMRQLLDQDKREVRLLQELLLEDGELAGGHRQRKFRWKNNDLEQQGTVPDEDGDKQDEIESEEQWRKQRHEREVFLRQLMDKKKEDTMLDVSFNRTSIIKANLESKSMSSLLLEVKSANTTSAETVAGDDNKILATNTAEKKTSSKELPSPVKKPFMMQKQFRGSFLSRGQSSLDRLAALARPLSGEEERPGLAHSHNKRSFVFSTVSPPCPNAQLDEKTKMAKRKADAEMSTPVLLKRFRVDDKRELSKKSLLDQIDT